VEITIATFIWDSPEEANDKEKKSKKRKKGINEVRSEIDMKVCPMVPGR
jgi:hypothetical protein